MTADEISGQTDPAAPLLNEKLAYQSFVLPGGATTAGHDRSYLNAAIFPSDFAGKSLLDIGSYLGYFCVEAMKRKGSRAVGIEPDPVSVRQAELIAKVHNVRPEYVCADFESWDSDRQAFDTVICLNVLHHMFDPVGAIQKMMRMASHRIVLEFAGPEFKERAALKLGALAGAAIPAILLGRPRKSHDALKRSFLFTPASMEVLFDSLTRLFEPVVITKSPFKGRYVLEATKRNIGHLVVLAGPTASGKSTLLEKLVNDPGTRAGFDITGDNWHVPRSDVDDLPRGRLDNVLLHYDLLRPYRRSTGTHARDPWTDYLSVAERVSIITLMPSRGILQRRIVSAQGDRAEKSESKRHGELRERYATPDFLRAWYGAWFGFLNGLAHVERSMLLVTDAGGERTMPAAAWEKEFDAIY